MRDPRSAKGKAKAKSKAKKPPKAAEPVAMEDAPAANSSAAEHLQPAVWRPGQDPIEVSSSTSRNCIECTPGISLAS